MGQPVHRQTCHRGTLQPDMDTGTVPLLKAHPLPLQKNPSSLQPLHLSMHR